MPARPVIRIGQSSRVETIDENSPLTSTNIVDGSEHNSSRERSILVKDVAGSLRLDSGRNGRNDVTDPAGTKRNRSKKSVHWNTKISKKRHLHLKDMKEGERESVWYSKQDDKLMLAIAKVTVRMMMKGEPCDDVDYCSRGLEGKTSVEAKKRAKNKRKVRAAVLMEQELQRLEGVIDPEQIANASYRYTKDLSTIAWDKAVKDENAVQEYLDDVRIHRNSTMKFIPSQSSTSFPSSE